MQTHQIHVSGAHERAHEIRGELLAFPEVLDVFVAGRPDGLVVVCAGRPRPGEWLSALRAIGYRTPARGHAGWRQAERQPAEVLLRKVVDCQSVDADDHDWTISSIRNEQGSSTRQIPGSIRIVCSPTFALSMRGTRPTHRSP